MGALKKYHNVCVSKDEICCRSRKIQNIWKYIHVINKKKEAMYKINQDQKEHLKQNIGLQYAKKDWHSCKVPTI